MKNEEAIKKQEPAVEVQEPAEVNIPEAVAEEAIEAKEEQNPSDDEKQIGWLRRLLGRDARVAHFVVDVLAGKSTEEAVDAYFPTKATVDAQLAEAEQRGYLRGRNEAVALDMKERPLWNSDSHPATSEQTPPSIPSILSRLRRSVWDK